MNIMLCRKNQLCKISTFQLFFYFSIAWLFFPTCRPLFKIALNFLQKVIYYSFFFESAFAFVNFNLFTF